MSRICPDGIPGWGGGGRRAAGGDPESGERRGVCVVCVCGVCVCGGSCTPCSEGRAFITVNFIIFLLFLFLAGVLRVPCPLGLGAGSVPAGGWRAAAVGGWWDGKGVARREGAAVRRGRLAENANFSLRSRLGSPSARPAPLPFAAQSGEVRSWGGVVVYGGASPFSSPPPSPTGPGWRRFLRGTGTGLRRRMRRIGIGNGKEKGCVVLHAT